MKFKSPLDHLMDHNCTACRLHEETERVCVGGSGDPSSQIMLLGEAPGGNEERTGRVFSGRAGEVLDLALREAGLERDGCYVSNVVKCRPPDNDTPDRVHWEACRQYLESEVRAVDPSHVLLLGNTALRAVWRRSGITKNRGVRLDCKDPLFARRTVMATIHPAYVLRNPGQASVFQEDVRRFARAIRGEFQVTTVKVKFVRTTEGLKQFRRLLEGCPEGTPVSYDVENRGRPWEENWAIVCLGVSFDGETTYVVPLSHPQSPFRKRWRDVLRYLKPGLERAGHKLVAQNGKHDNLQLAGAGVFLQHRFDIMLAAHLVDENRPKNLGFLSQTYLGADVYKGMVETKPEKIMKEPIKRLCLYNGYDTGYTHQLYPKLKKELVDNPRSLRLFAKLMMPASHVIQEVEYRGVYVHQDRLWARMRRLQELIDERKEVLYEHLPKKYFDHDDFNFNSTQQLGRWLFSKRGLGLSPLETTKSGRPSTKEAVLLHYHDHPAVRALLQYRTLQLKWMNTYLAPWSTKLDSRSRLHTTYKLYGTVTGRLSGDLQQVPRDTFIRGVIGAPPGWSYVAADFSQIELRIAAHVANETRMQRAFLMGEDLHLLMAAELTGKSVDEVGKEERKMAKPVNFGFLYGMYPRKFVKYAFENYGVDFTMAQAEQAREKYFRSFPGLLKWHDRQKRLAHTYHRVTSPLGRTRHLPDILSPDNGVRMEAERQAINSPVQGCATDMMLFAMVHCHKELNPHEAGMVITQHDEIGFEVRDEMVGEYMPVIKQVMETLPLEKTFGFKCSVPIIADVEAADHWPGIPDASGLGITDF
jgi:uracil-DNA glycosylase family 4